MFTLVRTSLFVVSVVFDIIVLNIEFKCKLACQCSLFENLKDD